MILDKLIKCSGKCNPKTKTYFSYAFHLRNRKSGRNYFLQIRLRIQNMSATYDTKKLFK